MKVEVEDEEQEAEVGRRRSEFLTAKDAKEREREEGGLKPEA
jgi:hypothetical protein